MTFEQRLALNLWMNEVSFALHRLIAFADPERRQAADRIFERLHQFEAACAEEVRSQSLREHANNALKPVTHLDCIGTGGGEATITTLKP